MALTNGQAQFYRMDYNYCSQEHQADGSVIITMKRDADSFSTVVHIQGWLTPNETVLAEAQVQDPLHSVLALRAQGLVS